MPRTTTIRIMAIALCMALLTSAPGAEDDNSGARLPAELAREVYAHLLKEYRVGKTGLDRVARLQKWSVEILAAEFAAIGELGGIAPEMVARSLTDCLTRVRKLEKLVARMVRKGKASEVELTAVRFYLQVVARPIEESLERASRTKELKMADPAPTRIPDTQIVVNVDKDGNYFFLGKKLTGDQLARQLKQYVAKNPGPRVVVRADAQCPSDAINRVIGLCVTAGVKSRVSIAIELPDEKNE